MDTIFQWVDATPLRLRLVLFAHSLLLASFLIGIAIL